LVFFKIIIPQNYFGKIVKIISQITSQSDSRKLLPKVVTESCSGLSIKLPPKAALGKSCGAAFDNNFGERLSKTNLWSSFAEQL
jgi:hypothetical protein